HRLAPEASPREIADQPPVCAGVVGPTFAGRQGGQERCALARHPARRDLVPEADVARLLLIEHPRDDVLGHLGIDALGAQLGRESGASPRPMPESVTYERGGDGRVVHEAPLLEAVEAARDALRGEPLLAETPVELP